MARVSSISSRISNGRLNDPGGPTSAGHEFTLFGDTIEELSGWYGFSDDYRADQERRLQETEAELAENEPYRNPFRGVGRNDPCPCGSGKKFKSCCLGLSGALT